MQYAYLARQCEDSEGQDDHHAPKQPQRNHCRHFSAPVVTARRCRQAGTTLHKIFILCNRTNSTVPVSSASAAPNSDKTPSGTTAGTASSRTRPVLRATRIQLRVCFRAL